MTRSPDPDLRCIKTDRTSGPAAAGWRSSWIVSSLVLSWALSTANAAVNQTEWKNRQSLEVREAGLIKVALPPETIDLARPGLTDLRILGPRGEEVAYAINNDTPPTVSRQTPANFRVELQRVATQLTIETGTKQPIERIHLVTSANDFVKAARLEISDDNARWELVGDGFQIARQRGLNALSVPLGKIVARYIRITVDDWRTPVVPFTAATLDLAADAEIALVPVEATILKREDFSRESVITLRLPARNLPLAWLEFAAREPIFSRVITVTEREFRDGQPNERTIATGSIFRSGAQESTRHEQARVPLEVSPASQEIQIHILNANNPPLTLERISVQRRSVWLYFHAETPGKYVVLTGNAIVAAPGYDVAQFVADWKLLPGSSLAFSPAEPNPGYQRPPLLPETPLLGASVDLSKWRFRKAVLSPAAGVQELELDQEVLASASSGLSDLRLVQDSRQVPYIIERSSLFRSLRLSPAEDHNPKTPRVSRWKLTLPVAALPLQRLTVASPTALFSRTLQLFEFTMDGRGERSRRNLSGAETWHRTPDDRAELTLQLNTFPLGDEVYLETDNGDNPPLQLGNVVAEYPVIRLLFRADTDPMHLYYDAEDVSAPRYDLALVSPRLLNEEKQTAALGPAEVLHPRGRGVSLFSGRSGGILLWTSLAVVVGALLFAIAKLLPKPSGSDSR